VWHDGGPIRCARRDSEVQRIHDRERWRREDEARSTGEPSETWHDGESAAVVGGACHAIDEARSRVEVHRADCAAHERADDDGRSGLHNPVLVAELEDKFTGKRNRSIGAAGSGHDDEGGSLERSRVGGLTSHARSRPSGEPPSETECIEQYVGNHHGPQATCTSVVPGEREPQRQHTKHGPWALIYVHRQAESDAQERSLAKLQTIDQPRDAVA
jgi:hypothetical protein